jgi:hypothetical protein
VSGTGCPANGADYYGQDGNFEINVPSYGIKGPELTDSVTGLVWRAGTGDAAQSDAAAGCASFGADWRLPSFLELSSLLDFGNAVNALPTAVDSEASNLWTATTTPIAGSTWSFSTTTGIPNMQGSTDVLGWACVSGPEITGELGAPTDGIVQDARTGLYWQTGTVTNRNWQEALLYCLKAAGAGLVTGWRLPTVKELLTIARPEQAGAIDTNLFNTPALVWSSTPVADNGSLAWAVEFQPLKVSPRDITQTTELRCVHDPI